MVLVVPVRPGLLWWCSPSSHAGLARVHACTRAAGMLGNAAHCCTNVEHVLSLGSTAPRMRSSSAACARCAHACVCQHVHLPMRRAGWAAAVPCACAGCVGSSTWWVLRACRRADSCCAQHVCAERGAWTAQHACPKSSRCAACTCVAFSLRPLAARLPSSILHADKVLPNHTSTGVFHRKCTQAICIAYMALALFT